ncbi:MAG TPA: alanine--tRNA ligase [Gemmatimonas aurantiaca]|uniref:Alanine--tRNA ligase n=2 Tax=Gemmatimonas aurantiaca TaxID=173480 RepID=C1A4D2_GEMAT|nr:alanine--tRNA ligase [Gemmatimonas aurantiaca]BAH38957.1 alanyl-tRNA synthetase [Gemmatimonas aurantiaca T-27]HCT57157.1 alanine--tRNA ligase [Gemmatimonas aurantiaca]
MNASEIRSRFLAFFEKNGHAIRPSSSLVPADDPTLLFTNAGMVQFKKVFLGMEEAPDGKRRATTSQKCVRAGGKHNDLEQVGHTARHHTFFEMLGNFSFGDYFKRDAIKFAWEFITEDLKIPREHLRVTVFHEDDEARQLWKDVADVPENRIYGLGAKDNFWQMADTGPCGPCTEIYVDLAKLAADWAFPADATGEWTNTEIEDYSLDAFVEGAEAGRFLEIWNLVFMQFDRQADGTLVPLPKPSVDTGAGLERIAAVMQGVTNNFHTDLFRPLIAKVEDVVGIGYPYRPGVGLGKAYAKDGQEIDPASFRVLADHARAVGFLLADGVFPSNEGRGYVLRRILRRAVRHAWLLGRREPTLVHVVEVLIDTMRDLYPELHVRRKHILETTRAEEDRFLTTIDAGMSRFEELAPAASTQGSTTMRGTLSGEDAFRLYDTFGFPIDLTDLMARERGYLVDIAGFERSLQAQRKQSQEDRKSRQITVSADDFADPTHWTHDQQHQAALGRFVGYETTEIETIVTAVRQLPDGRVAVMLRETPFYAESGGQVSDHGTITGEGWTVEVNEVRKLDGRIAAIGSSTGEIIFGRAHAVVPRDRRRDTERHHTATHLLHAALRKVLGDHVHQAGSLVTPDRLRFDFTHHGPVTAEQLAAIEADVNAGVWQSAPVNTREESYVDAVAHGAMALFGEKYGDVVRVVEIPSLSVELCGGTHVRNTAEIGLVRVINESGVAAGVRRIEAVSGPRAFQFLADRERALLQVASRLKVPMSGMTSGAEQIERKLDALMDERKQLEKRLEESLRGGGAGGGLAQQLIAKAIDAGGTRFIAAKVDVPDVKALQALGDAVREALGSGVAVLGAALADGKGALLAVATDDARDRGLRADAVVRDVAATVGGRGGGKPHMAQAGVEPGQIDAALAAAEAVVNRLASTGA